MKLLTILLSIFPIITSSSKIATGVDLLSEMTQLQASLTHLQSLMNDASVGEDKELMNKAAKLFRRARWMIYSSNHEVSPKRNAMNSKHLRGGIGSGDMNSDEDEGRSIKSTVPRIVGLADSSREFRELDGDNEMKDVDADRVARKMYDATIAFPECKELFLEECLQLISAELAALEISCEVVIREKRSADQPGYNKVVIITDLSAEVVTGRNKDGIVSYPFMWEDAKTGNRMVGVDGKWDCKGLSPEECCDQIKTSVPNPDVKGNYLQCHIFVPFGGVGNKKRSDRVFVNLSQDGRVQESPFVS